jgi:glycosyltransferase A (GT-A) superfamily protein (DUF2064 family)
MRSQRLILFAKVPEAGRVKNRLAPLLDAVAASELYQAFVLDTCELLMSFCAVADVELCLDRAGEVWPEWQGILCT